MLDLDKLKQSVNKNADAVLYNANNFLIFIIVAILSTLLFFKQTQDNVASTLILSILWYYFWTKSSTKGRVFLVVASIVGFLHEIVGVYFGWFTYIGGVIGGVPLWILPGYGAIFWASYNFWIVFEKTHKDKSWFPKVNFIAFLSFAVIVVIDYVLLDLSLSPIFTVLKIMFAFLLFKRVKHIRLAYFVGLFTVFDEIAGELIGVWAHPEFSILSLMAGYIFLLWTCLTITDIIKKEKKWNVIELSSAFFLFVIMIFNLAV